MNNEKNNPTTPENPKVREPDRKRIPEKDPPSDDKGNKPVKAPTDPEIEKQRPIKF